MRYLALSLLIALPLTAYAGNIKYTNFIRAKVYQVVNDPDGPHYVVLASIIYCNITKPEMPVEAMVVSGIDGINRDSRHQRSV